MTLRSLVSILLTLAATTPALQSSAAISASQLWPADDRACVDTPLRLTFNEPPTLGNRGRITVVSANDGKTVDAIHLGDSNFTNNFGGKPLRYEPVLIDGNSATIRLHSHSLNNGESYYVRIDPGVFKDAAGADFEGIASPEKWRFKTKDAPAKTSARLIVASDGSGDFCTVQGAVDQAPSYAATPTTIFIRNGIHDGVVRIVAGKNKITLAGEDRQRTILTGRNNERMNIGMRGRALIGVEADDFTLENMTVINRTPYKGTQAEAVRIRGDRCIVRNADLKSFQDTLLLDGRVYVSNCYVEGDVDFIWGYGTACFEQCEIRAMHNGYYVQARNPAGKPGYVFIRCKLSSAPDVTRCWLARIESERFPASQAAYLNCQMGSHIPAAGWEISGTKNDALQFQEFESTDLDGKPLDVSHRHPASKQLNAAEAAALSDVRALLGGHDGWDPKKSAGASAGKIFNIREFGAIGDGTKLDTAALQKALEAAGHAGGGMVRVPPGAYLIQPVRLYDNVTLQLDDGATLQGTDEPAAYGINPPGPSGKPLSLINGQNLTNITISGSGTIDGAGKKWWDAVRAAKRDGKPEPARPRLVSFKNCQGVRVEGVTLANSPMFHLVPSDCQDVVIKGITILAPADSPNTDGIDPAACRRVEISECRIDVGDDNIAIKSGHHDPAHPAACADITVFDCTFLHGHGVSIGSETVGGVENLFVQRCTFTGTRYGLRLKSPRGRGGLVEKIRFSDITMTDVDPAITFTCYYPKVPAEDTAQPVGDGTPAFRKIQIMNLTATCKRGAGMIVGLPESPITDLSLDNVNITAKSGFTIKNTAGLKFRNVTMNGEPLRADGN